MRYEPVGKERFTVETTADGERIRIRPPRQIFLMLFLLVWLIGWTLGGGATMRALATGFQPFLAVWLCGWALGWLAAAATLVWMFAGSETIGVVGADMEIAHHALGFTRRRLYRGSEIRNLTTVPPAGQSSPFRWQPPLFRMAGNGAIRFDYGARSVHAAPGLDETEAELVVKRLKRRLPRAVSARPSTE